MTAIVGLVMFGMIALSACGGASSSNASTGSGGSGAAAPSGASRPVAIKIGSVGFSGTYVPVFVAYDLGFFKQHGLDASYQSIRTPIQSKELIAGKLQFATIATSLMLDANAAGNHQTMIAAMTNTPGMSVYASPAIKSIQDLKGKAVAVGSVGSASYVAVQIMLAKYGMKASIKGGGGAVKLLPVTGGSPNILATLERGLVQAAVFSPPSTVKAKAQGFHEILKGPALHVKWTQGGVVTTQQFIASHPQAVKGVGAALAQAWAFLANPANKAKAIAEIAKCTGTKKTDAAATYAYLHPIWASQKAPTVALQGMQTAIKYTPAAVKAGLQAQKEFNNSFLSSGGR